MGRPKKIRPEAEQAAPDIEAMPEPDIKDIPMPEKPIIAAPFFPIDIGQTNSAGGFPSPDMFRAGFYDQGLKHLFDKQKIHMIGRLSPDMVTILRRLKIMEDSYNLEDWGIAMRGFVEIGISENGESRKEILRMVEGMTSKKKSMGEKLKEALGGNKNRGGDVYNE